MKTKRTLLLLIAIFITTIFTQSNSKAAEDVLKDLKIDVSIREDGSASIKETWKINIVEANENLRQVNNLGKAKIVNFKVTEDGKTYESLKKWNSNGTRGEKEFKSASIKRRKGYELHWGLGEPGEHEYTIEYTIIDFIKELKDGQILFWRFFNQESNMPPQKISLTVDSKIPFNKDDQQILALGFEEKIGFKDGKIVARSKRALNENEYFTILTKFNKGTFQTKNTSKESFEEIQAKALKGNDYGKAKGESKLPIIFKYSLYLLPAVIILGEKAYRKLELNMGISARINRKHRDEYYRNEPYDGNILDIYYILDRMGKSSFDNILTGFMLKWVKEERIKLLDDVAMILEQVDNKARGKSTNIHFLNTNLPENHLEGELFAMFLFSAKNNKILYEEDMGT